MKSFFGLHFKRICVIKVFFGVLASSVHKHELPFKNNFQIILSSIIGKLKKREKGAVNQILVIFWSQFFDLVLKVR